MHLWYNLKKQKIDLFYSLNAGSVYLWMKNDLESITDFDFNYDPASMIMKWK